MTCPCPTCAASPRTHLLYELAERLALRAFTDYRVGSPLALDAMRHAARKTAALHELHPAALVNATLWAYECLARS